MRRESLSRLALCAALLLNLSALAFGQGTASRVTGVVLDQTGAAVGGATVTLTHEATNVSFTTQTTPTGNYTFDSVQVGTYTVTVEMSGFRKFVSGGNTVNVNQPATVDVTLEPGDITETVTVQAAAELVQTSSSGNFGNTVEQRTLETLPIVGVRGRNPLSLINFQPGVVSGANTGGGVHVHGARDRAFNFTLDGIDINESSAGGSNFTPLRPNPDSLTEFQVVTSNFTAELGRSSGAQVTLVTRSGTNDLHGNLFEFYQTPRLLANEYNNNINGTPRGQFVQHIFGGSVGGPVVLPGVYNGRNRTFFFFNLQLLRTSQSIARTRTVLTETARQGIFRYVAGGRNNPAGVAGASVNAAGAALLPPCGGGVTTNCIATYNVAANDPAGLGLDPTVQSVLAATPLPNNFTALGDGLNFAAFTFLAPQTERQYDMAFKIDHAFNERNTVYVRYAQGEQNTLGDAGNGNTNTGFISGNAGGPQAFPDSPRNIDTLRNPKNLAVNYRWTPAPTVTNEFVAGFNRFTFSFNNADPNAEENTPVRFDCPFSGTSGCLDLTNPFDNTPIINNARSLRTYQFVDNLSWLRGSHTLRFGTNLRFQQHLDDRGQAAGLYVNPQVDFSRVTNPPPAALTSPAGINTANDQPRLRSFYNTLLGRVGNIGQGFVADAGGGAFGPPGSRFPFDARYPEYDFYGQDTWKIRPNLTLDFGLRWEAKPSPSSAGDLPILRPEQAIRLGEAPSNTLRWTEGQLYDGDYNNFAPVVGFAWDPFEDGKTSVRGNFRVAYDRTNTFVFSSFIFNTAPGATTGVVNSTFGTQPNEQGRLRFGLPALAPPASVTPEALRQPPVFSNNSITVVDPSLRSPKTYQWGASLQREVGWDSVVEVNYIGRKGVGLYGAYDVNQVNIFARDPRFDESFLDAFRALRASASATSPLINALLTGDPANNAGSTQFRSLFTSELNLGSVAAAADSLARRLTPGSGTVPVIVTNGFSPFFFRPYPQFSGAVNVVDSNDFSFYNALEVQWSRRFSRGLSYQLAYTLARSMDTRSFDPAFTTAGRGTTQTAANTPFDINNRRLNYARSDFDRTHSLQGYLVYDIPFGRGRRFLSDAGPVVDRLLGGFELATILVWQSGRPFTVYSGANTLSNVLQTPANCDGCSGDLGELQQESGTNFFFNQSDRARFSAPGPGEFSNTGRNFFTGPTFFNLDLMLGKKIHFNESVNFEIRAEMQNATNTPAFDFPTAVITNGTFGRIRGAVVNTARRVQLAAKFNF
ncbi:MAG TPA: carboxypeptidase-like regulatory domain-containing protein [Pyrinomonadaceae bacterium]|nr:carboxypeptidase-like regulatory domain-containing protein [Pyrinomonadaceae bacterium]